MIRVEISNRQAALDVDVTQLRDAITEVLKTEGLQQAEVSLAIIGDAEIHDLNKRYLQHDYPTDVLSFVLERSATRLDGEIIVSTETALERCHEFGWSATNELTLYAIHGTLHLVGFNDKTAVDRAQMRERERFHLTNLGIEIPAQSSTTRPPDDSAKGGHSK
ncbi:MAG: rRNA maturation RNase YbeY [Planctomycetaceae bacterium]|nr:rRNA maturation RNase YbeY [Planctomycetaceae bacterium]